MIGGSTSLGLETARRGPAEAAEAIVTGRDPEQRTRKQYLVG